MVDNIILIGMAGCGKSTLGKKLAKRLNMEFFDPDRYIEDQEGKTLQELVDTLGEGGFLLLEERYIKDLDMDSTVIAPGGSCVLSASAMKHLESLGKIVYLDVPFSVIENRLKNIYTRGIVGLEKMDLKDVFKMRTPLYEKYADVVIKTEGKSRSEIMEEVVKKVGGEA